MRYKIYINSNIFYIEDTEDSNRLYEGHAKDVLLRRENTVSTSIAFTNVNNWDRTKVIHFTTDVDLTDAPYTDFATFVTWAEENTGKSSGGANGEGLENRIIVTQENVSTTLGGEIDSSKEYFIDGKIDMGSTSIEIPVTGISISGYSFDISGLSSSQSNYTMFTSPVGGSGNLVCKDIEITATGTNSKIFDITDHDGNSTIEITAVNYVNCFSLGEITGYRQLLETGTGRFGLKPSLTFSGNWNGVRISTSIVRGITAVDSLFKAGTGLVFSGRFITDINADLPATGALIDFSDTNITNDESLILKGAFVTRSGVIDASDTTIYPNIDHTSVKSLWNDNTGLPNTNKYIKGSVTTEVTTVVNAINTYYPLEGTITIDSQSHFDMPENGEYRLLSGNGSYQVTGDFVLDSNQNNEVDIRITKSTDGGLTYPTEVNHIKRIINSLSGGRDVGFFPINFIVDLKENDRLRVEVENKSGTANITAELDSYLIISQI